MIQKYKNDYFLYLLSEGNLGKIKKVESEFEPYLDHVTDNPFSGDYGLIKFTIFFTSLAFFSLLTFNRSKSYLE